MTPTNSELTCLREESQKLLSRHPSGGRIGFAAGDTFDASKGDIGGAGSLGVVPANQSHFVWTENEEAGVQVQFVGPAAINYVNPADDTRKQ